MTTTLPATDTGAFVHANGIDLHYYSRGTGRPLVLLPGGGTSASPIWAQTPFTYAGFLDRLAENHHVITVDPRGQGQTRHPGGPISWGMAIDDIAGLIEGLELDRPVIGGFSDGGILASVVALRHPTLVSGVVNDAGFDYFRPDSPSYPMMRAMFGGSPDATEPDEGALRAAAAEDPGMGMYLRLMVEDHDSAQGEGAWFRQIQENFGRASSWTGYGEDELRGLEVPTLILVGDRDLFCPVPEAAWFYGCHPNAQLAVFPATGHEITPAKIEALLAFVDALV